MPPETLAAAARRSLALGIGADRVLITARAISEDDYARVLAASLHLVFEPLEHLPRSTCPLSDAQLIDVDKNGLLPLHIAGAFIWVIAPCGLTARHLATGTQPIPTARIRLTSSRRMRSFVMRHGVTELGKRAAGALRTARPELSAATRPSRVSASWLGAAAALVGAAILFPRAASVLTNVMLALTFLAWTVLRLVGAITAWHGWRPARLAPERLPVYTIILALYDEAAAVAGLVESLRRLEYPPEKLQIILALEPDDLATRDALARHDLAAPFEIIIAPDAGPRTKPKALNAALTFARGTFTAVFDAEDRPASDQLLRALDAFLDGREGIDCVQARLTIDNTADGWLARHFTAEYSGLFDVLLPGLSQWRLPLPLGGSSNHFRTAAVREAGGWDPYNVTEDADLGMRLARFGYRAAVIGSTTYEEAPAHAAPWLRQRTRWFKGWMQTWAVHMRHPVRLARELGLAGFATFQLVVGGTVLAALVHPVFAALLVHSLIADRLFTGGADIVAALQVGLSGGALVAGYLASAILGLIGLKRRGLMAHAWVLLLTPLHWLLLSAAAWRALYQLLRDPYRWEKTQHGLARTSRLAAQALRSRTTIKLRSNAADRPQRPRAAA